MAIGCLTSVILRELVLFPTWYCLLIFENQNQIHYIGAGFVLGLVNLLTAKAMGAAEVIITDINEGRLQVAKSLGADHIYKVYL